MNNICFNFNKNKSLEVLLYISSKCKDVKKISAIVYFSDKNHLNKFGRPITGDFYFKNEFGIIPNFFLELRAMDLTKLHFEIKNNYLISKRKFNKKLLSKSDVDILDHWINNIKKLNHQEIFKLYENENSWLKTKFNDLVLFEDIIENLEVLNDLKDCDPFLIVI